jgi:helicase
VQYGIKEELVELTKLKGVGRVRARNLFKHDIKNLDDLKHAGMEKIAAIPQIGKTVAKSILEQLSAEEQKKEIRSVTEGWDN